MRLPFLGAPVSHVPRPGRAAGQTGPSGMLAGFCYPGRMHVTQWWPGDVRRVGPRHGTHAPPFYVCGSDQWAAGYMEGAVRTGRATASAMLGAAQPA